VGDFSGGAIATWHVVQASSRTIRAAQLNGDGNVTAVQELSHPVVARMELRRLRPNPARGGVQLDLAIPHRERASVEVFDVQGRRVATLLSEQELDIGIHPLRWEAAVAPGLYFVHARAGSETDTRRIVRIR
jgi:hypothetical protein